MSKKYKIPSIKELVDAGVHFGHQVRRWHPNMEPYIYTARKGIHIIDLEETERLLGEAAEFLYDLATQGKKIVFVGTKKQARDAVELSAKRCGAMYVTERWLGGTITNLDVIKKNNIDKLLSLKKRKEEDGFKTYTKKERLLIDREIERLEKFVGGLTNLKGKPDVLVVVDSKREKTAVSEALKAKIPVIALLDTNADPTKVTYPIPVNDDAIKSISIIVKALADAVEVGYLDYGNKNKEPNPEIKTEKVVVKEHIEKDDEVKAKKEAIKEEKAKVSDKKIAKKEEKSKESVKKETPKVKEPEKKKEKVSKKKTETKKETKKVTKKEKK